MNQDRINQEELDRINNLSAQLDNNIQRSINKLVEKQESNNMAVIYLLQNIEKLKYILSGYPMVERHAAIIHHLENLFPPFDHKQVEKILFKNGIYKAAWIDYVPTLITLYIAVQYIFMAYPHKDSFPTMGGLFLMHLSGLICIMWLAKKLSNTYKLTYRLEDQYKTLPRPVNIKW